HISKNFRYPEEAQKKGIQGRVNTMFVIQRDGSIGDVATRGPGKLLEEEAARIISLLPKMIPGKHRGRAVRIPFSIPITFDLDRANVEEEVSVDKDTSKSEVSIIVKEAPMDTN